MYFRFWLFWGRGGKRNFYSGKLNNPKGYTATKAIFVHTIPFVFRVKRIKNYRPKEDESQIKAAMSNIYIQEPPALGKVGLLRFIL